MRGAVVDGMDGMDGMDDGIGWGGRLQPYAG